MGKPSANAKKGIKTMFHLPWKKSTVPAATKTKHRFVASFESVARDPVAQCVVLLLFVTSVCLILKARRRRIKLKAAQSMLSSTSVPVKEVCLHSLSSPKDEGKLCTSPVVQSTASKNETASARSQTPTTPPAVLQSENQKWDASPRASTAGLMSKLTIEGGPLSDGDSCHSHETSRHSNSEESSIQHSLSTASNSSGYQRRNYNRSTSWGSCFTCDSSTIGGASFISSNSKPAYLTIYYASQSGTSAYFSAQLQREAAEMGFDVALRSVRSLEEHLRDELFPEEELGKYCCRIRQRAANSGDAKDVEYDFEIFKWRKLFPRLADLSVRDSFKQVPLSGDETGEPSDEIGKEKKKKGRLSRNKSSASLSDPDGGFDLQIIDASMVEMPRSPPVGKIHASARHFVKGVECPVKQVKKLWQDVDDATVTGRPSSALLMEIDISPSPDDGGIECFRYETGDYVCVLPVNNISIVEEVAKHLDVSVDTTFMLVPKNENDPEDFEPPFPTPCTVRDYLSFYCELSTPPRRSIVRSLSQFATFDGDRDELYRISSVKNCQEFQRRVVDENMGLADLITTYFPSIQIPLAKFIRHCSPLQPRWYSASSSSLVNPHSLSITFSVLSIPRTIDTSVCRGVCSHYMASLSRESNDRCRITRMGSSGFVAPKDSTTPLVMVCNGTGISPFRALLQEINYKKTVLKQEIGPAVLFYGIRRRDYDLLFKEELDTYLENGSLADLYVACSRETEQKVYVQDLLAQHSAQVWTLLQSGAHIYTCGSTSMTNDVDTVLRSMASRFLGPVEASAFMDEIEKEHRYVKEGWTL
ncbi:FAD-binding domain-containing protein [Fragilaria crotonensis]|nr:FAD-binding domain-containing protein [Fragilaria crotonensis]